MPLHIQSEVQEGQSGASRSLVVASIFAGACLGAAVSLLAVPPSSTLAFQVGTPVMTAGATQPVMARPMVAPRAAPRRARFETGYDEQLSSHYQAGAAAATSILGMGSVELAAQGSSSTPTPLLLLGALASLASAAYLWVARRRPSAERQVPPAPMFDESTSLRQSKENTLYPSRRTVLSAALPAALYASAPAFAEELATAEGEGGLWSFTYPADWETQKKPVKTHFQELEVKSTTIKKCSVGIAVDPIKLESLETFGTPDFVGGRVVGVEKQKNGVFGANLLDASSETVDGQVYYNLDYGMRSERGDYHFLAKVAVSKGYLFVVTAKVKDENFAEAEPIVRQILDSVKVPV